MFCWRELVLCKLRTLATSSFVVRGPSPCGTSGDHHRQEPNRLRSLRWRRCPTLKLML